MVKRKRTGPTAERFVEATLDLIAEKGGSHDVNLRAVARRVGHAHTNAYNYFESFEDLLWEAFRRVLLEYAEAIVTGLDDSLSPRDYFERLVTNLANYPAKNPGLYRFIGSDPIDPDSIPADVLATVSVVKSWLLDAFRTLSGPGVTARDAEDFCNITYGYIDGETFNYINARVVPGEDIPARIVENSLRLFDLLARDDGSPRTYPKLALEHAP